MIGCASQLARDINCSISENRFWIVNLFIYFFFLVEPSENERFVNIESATLMYNNIIDVRMSEHIPFLIYLLILSAMIPHHMQMFEDKTLNCRSFWADCVRLQSRFIRSDYIFNDELHLDGNVTPNNQTQMSWCWASFFSSFQPRDKMWL